MLTDEEKQEVHLQVHGEIERVLGPEHARQHEFLGELISFVREWRQELRRHFIRTTLVAATTIVGMGVAAALAYLVSKGMR